jgi:hypothetical protein
VLVAAAAILIPVWFHHWLGAGSAQFRIVLLIAAVLEVIDGPKAAADRLAKLQLPADRQRPLVCHAQRGRSADNLSFGETVKKSCKKRLRRSPHRRPWPSHPLQGHRQFGVYWGRLGRPRSEHRDFRGSATARRWSG